MLTVVCSIVYLNEILNTCSFALKTYVHQTKKNASHTDTSPRWLCTGHVSWCSPGSTSKRDQMAQATCLVPSKMMSVGYCSPEVCHYLSISLSTLKRGPECLRLRRCTMHSPCECLLRASEPTPMDARSPRLSSSSSLAALSRSSVMAAQYHMLIGYSTGAVC